MKATIAMVKAARRAEFDYYQRGRALSADRFIPTPDAVIRVMIQAALDALDPVNAPQTAAPVTAKRTIVNTPPSRRR